MPTAPKLGSYTSPAHCALPPRLQLIPDPAPNPIRGGPAVTEADPVSHSCPPAASALQFAGTGDRPLSLSSSPLGNSLSSLVPAPSIVGSSLVATERGATARIYLLRSAPPALLPAPSRPSSPPVFFSVTVYTLEEGGGAAARGSRGGGVHPA